MSLVFPTNPYVNQTTTTGGRTWTYNGSGWVPALSPGGNLQAITSNLIPSSDLVYDLGSIDNRWRDLYLSGNTIDLGGTAIKTVGGSVTFTDSENPQISRSISVAEIAIGTGANLVTLTSSATGIVANVGGVVSEAIGATGATGPAGTTGVDGATGATGIGTAGATGLTGATGAPGPAGTGGSGSGANVTVSNTAPISANIGNMWLDDETGKLRIYYGGGWAGVAVGPIGATGATGAAGTIGVNGTTGATGATGPQGATGAGANAYDVATVSTGYISIPVGNTAQRPVSPPEGAMRVNITSTNKVLEIYNLESNVWVSLSTIQNYGITIEYLVVAGGGGGGSGHGGGGGAGGFRTNVTGATSGGGSAAESSKFVLTNTNYTVTVGGGGAGANPGSPGRAGTTGSNSVFDNITSLGGGGGGGGVAPNMAGLAGGSSGGVAGQSGGSLAATPGTVGQGYAGGKGNGGGDGGGGGGAGGNAPDAGNNGGLGPRGGFGANSSITGTAVTYAGGGGGGGGYNTGTPTGIGQAGGGNGGVGAGGPGLPATTNSGSGGGGGGWNDALGANGGSGLIIIKYTNSATMSNPGGGLTFSTATSSGFKITTFTAGTGTITFS